MGKHFWLLPVAAAGLLLAACGTHVMHKGCTLDGHTSMTEYDMAYLTDLQRQRLDSTVLNDGKFSFEVADSVAQPFALIVQLVDNEQADALLEMPLMVENGHISLEIGEYIQTAGTPLNEGIQQFLNELQTCKDKLAGRKDITPQEIGISMSKFYKQQILLNKSNALGHYIYHDYGAHLTPTDREEVKTQLTQSTIN